MDKNISLEPQTVKRNIGVDLLRLIAVFMIVMLHTLRGATSSSSLLYIWVEPFLFGGFNLIALIAGYAFCIEKFNMGRVIRLWVTGIFYSAVFYLVTSIVRSNFSWTKFIKSFFPVLTNNSYFWLFAPYILLLLLIPIFNFAIEKLPRKGYFGALIFFAVLFSAVQFSVDPWGINDGRSAFWLIYLYFVGAYFRKYGFPVKKWWINLCVFVGSALLNSGLYLLTSQFHFKFWEERYVNYFHQYNCLLALICAVALMALFAQLPIQQTAEKTVRYFSSHSLGIYLSHSFLILYFCNLLSHPEWNHAVRLLVVIAFALCVFVAGFLIEALRKLLFKYARIDALTDKIGAKLSSKAEEE